MKIKLLFFSLFFVSILTAQITFQGCPSVLGAQNFVLSATDTTNDAGTIRNTYESTPLNFGQSCPAGVCEIRIIWNDVSDRWEIQLDNDGPVNTPNYTTAVLYFSTTTSHPNPPDIASGSWQSAGFCPGTISTMSGDVDDGSTLSIDELASVAKTIKIYPNPVRNILNIETESAISKVEIYTLLGKEILKKESKNIDVSVLPQGLYFIKISSSEGIETVKRFIKK